MGLASSISVGDGIATAALGDTLVTLWRDPAEAQRVRWLTDRLNEHAAALPGSMLHLMLVLATSSPPGADGRAAFQKQVKDLDHAKKLRKFVTVALGDSFWINIVRTMGRTILFLAGKSHLLVILSNIDEGLSAIRAHASSTTPENAELLRATRQLADALGIEPAVVPGFLPKA
jgi:hypothetical protein